MQKKPVGWELNSQNEVIFSNTELNFISWMHWIQANHNVVAKKTSITLKYISGGLFIRDGKNVKIMQQSLDTASSGIMLKAVIIHA